MSMTPDEILELARAPKRTTTDEGTVEERSMDEIIAANEAATRLGAPDRVFWGLRVARTQPRGTV